MKAPAMEYARARSLSECLDLLAAAGDDRVTKVIAGGQSLLPLIHLGLAAPTHLVDVNALTDLDGVHAGRRHLQIGALTHHQRLATDPLVARHAPLLAAAAAHIGHVAIRHRGTIGGSVAHADPAAELPAALLVLDATMVCLSAGRGIRRIPVTEFLDGPYTVDLADDELLAWIEVPRPAAGTRFGFHEFALRHGDYARAGAAVRIGPDGAARAVLFAIEPRPVVISGPPAELTGQVNARLGRTVLTRALRAATP